MNEYEVLDKLEDRLFDLDSSRRWMRSAELREIENRRSLEFKGLCPLKEWESHQWELASSCLRQCWLEMGMLDVDESVILQLRKELAKRTAIYHRSQEIMESIAQLAKLQIQMT